MKKIPVIPIGFAWWKKRSKTEKNRISAMKITEKKENYE